MARANGAALRVGASPAAVPSPSSSAGSVILEREHGPHPRILLTPDRLAAVRGLRAAGAPSWTSLQAHCDEDVHETIGSGYEAWDWVNAALDLALCQAITGRAEYAQAAVKYFRALLDDQYKVGDGGGGDAVVHHDDGYSIRTRGCFGAIAFDWLHDVARDDPRATQARGRSPRRVDEVVLRERLRPRRADRELLHGLLRRGRVRGHRGGGGRPTRRRHAQARPAHV